MVYTNVDPSTAADTNFREVRILAHFAGSPLCTIVPMLLPAVFMAYMEGKRGEVFFKFVPYLYQYPVSKHDQFCCLIQLAKTSICLLQNLLVQCFLFFVFFVCFFAATVPLVNSLAACCRFISGGRDGTARVWSHEGNTRKCVVLSMHTKHPR